MIKKLICTTLSGLLLLTCLVSLNLYRQSTTTISLKIHTNGYNVFLPEINRVSASSIDAQNIIHDQSLVWISEKNDYRPVLVGVPRVVKKAKKVEAHKAAPEIKIEVAQVKKGQLYNVNGEQRFQHYGFDHKVEVEITSLTSYFDSLNIEANLIALRETTKDVQKNANLPEVEKLESNNSDVLLSMMDEVSTQLSAATDEAMIENNDHSYGKDVDLVLIDYSQESNEEDLIIEQLVTQGEAQQTDADEPIKRMDRTINNMVGDLAHDSDIPESVLMAIQRTLDTPSAPIVAMNTQPAVNTQAPRVDTVTERKAAAGRSNLDSQRLNNQSISRNTIQFYAVDINKDSKSANIANVEFHSDIIMERLSDNGTGTIFLEEKLNNRSGSIRGTFLSGGYVPTKMDISLEPGNFELNIPLLSSHQLNRFLHEENLSAHGGLLLVQLASTTDSVEIDAYYEAKIYLDRSFKVVEQSNEYDFILFTGVTAGNVMIKQRNFRSELAQKIIHVTDDELYFEGGQFIDRSNDILSLEAINLLGRKNSVLDINAGHIKVFNTNKSAQKLAIAKYEVAYPLQSAGMRKYLEMTHLRGSIFVGYADNRELRIPSQELVYHIIEAHGLRSLENTCMIQVNFKNQVSQIEVFGESNKGPMALITTYLDNDGYWSQEPTELTEQMFIAGDERGSVSLRVEYLDGSKDYLQTFCSYDTYLVEQL
jgi:hypothetical protein